MASRAIQNSLRFLYSPSPTFQICLKPQTMRTHRSPSSGGGALYCTCASADDPFVLTTPLYYVNAPPHLGSAYTTIAADAIASFQRLLGKKVIFITGTDEHGEKIAGAAAASGSNPIEHCDSISQAYKALWRELDISYDKFIRTTDPKHENTVKEFYSKVRANGDIYRADYEGLYCVNCEEYKDEKELLENNCCPMHLRSCVRRKEDNYFFSLSKYQKQLEETLAANPDFVRPSFRLNEVQGWIKSGLIDFSISRSSVDWGITVPNDSKQTIYVWFDALLGYISALLGDEQRSNLQTAISSGWPASLHLIGKDILRFRAVYWPTMLMSAGLSLPKKVFGHGFLTKVEKAQQHYENLELSTACETGLEIGNAGNVYIDEKAPWSLFKQGGAAFETAAKLACPTSALVRTSFSFLRKFSTTESAGEAAGASTNKPKRKKKKNFFEVAQFLPNWGIGYYMAKTHWTDVSYQITKINLYKDGRHGKAWGIAHKAGVPTTDAPKKISGVHKRGWRYIANSNKTKESTTKSEFSTV